MKDGNTLFPVFLKLSQLNVLIVGGGNVGLEKLGALLKNDPKAKVTIVADRISDAIRAKMEASDTIKIIPRKYQSRDLGSADIAILATDNSDLHYRIRHEATELGVLLNVADTPDLCDFYLGSTVKKGDLKIGISTNGKSPTVAKRFREVLDEVLPNEVEDLLQNLKKIRDRLTGNLSFKIKELNRITKSLVE